jgi:hypothetical protein
MPTKPKFEPTMTAEDLDSILSNLPADVESMSDIEESCVAFYALNDSTGRFVLEADRVRSEYREAGLVRDLEATRVQLAKANERDRSK